MLLMKLFLYLDATTGQNALSQASFSVIKRVNGLGINQTGWTAKGGIVIAIRQELSFPVKFVGLGEKMDDLQPFDSEQFVHAFLAGLMQDAEERRRS